MSPKQFAILAIGGIAVSAPACGHTARLPVTAGMGPHPTLPAPSSSLIPTIKVAKAVRWPAGVVPNSDGDLVVNAFADSLDHPRWVYVLPNGDVLVSETNAPDRPEENKGFRNWIMKHFQKKAGAAVPSANRISLLRDADGDGVAESRFPFLERQTSPFGIALVGGNLYVANSDALVRFPYVEGQTHISVPGETVVLLPAGRRNHHWTKNVIASPDGSKLYVTVGSNSNVAEHGMDEEEGRAAIWEVDVASRRHRIFASGLRNPNGMAWEPTTGQLWTSVNERDELGSDLVPDYITSVRDGGFYGWPYSYYGSTVDRRVKPPRPDLVSRAIVPDYALGSHTASLGLASSTGTTLPVRFRNGMFVGQHGSWNRRPRSGYKVIFVPFTGGKPAGDALDVLTGFLDEENRARGRPVGVAIDKRGALLVADDVGNIVWRVTAAAGAR
jgi:glucose/arabinose dehydrogenase